MTPQERFARLPIMVLAALIAASICFVAYRQLARPTPDARTGSTGLAVEVDAETGCQYVVTPWGGIFARLDRDGKPLCRAPAPSP